MAAPKLPFSLHDGGICSVVLGPRRELTLELDLVGAAFSDPRLPAASSLRFGAIENFADVSAFFSRYVGDPDGARINGMTSTREGASKGHCRFFIDIEHWGVVEICCAKATLTPEPTP